MTLRASRKFSAVSIVAAFFLTISEVGCTSIQLIAPYDQKIDEGVTKLQKVTAEFFTKIERQGGSKPEDYKNHVKFYDDTKVALSGILVRANAVAQNDLTARQLEILHQQFQDLEAMHRKNGISQAAVRQEERAFNRTFTAILTLEVAKKQPKAEGSGK
jgi:hypothetical protein